MIAFNSDSANARLLETTRRMKVLPPPQLRIVPAEFSSQTAWPSRVAVGCVPHLYYGDNFPILRERIPDESVDLIYLARLSEGRKAVEPRHGRRSCGDSPA